jgi:hypothetical protein
MSSVDVVVPCYNYASYLEQCVRSVLTQRGVKVRVLILDDASTDETPLVGSRLAEQDSRVEFRRHETNKGHIATYNEGLLQWAAADYCLLLSADDYLADESLARAAAVMDANDSVAVAYGRALAVVDERIPPAPPDAASSEHRIMSGKAFIAHCCLTASNPVPTPSAIVRTVAQREAGGYRPDLPHSGDLEMWLRLAVHGDVAALRGILAYRRFHSCNMSNAYYGASSDWIERVKAYEAVYTQWGSAVPEFATWMAAMRRALATELFWHGSRHFDEGREDLMHDCLVQALVLDPTLDKTAMWRKLRLKKALGWTIWKRIGPMLDRGRRNRSKSSGERQLLLGWWPQGSR